MKTKQKTQRRVTRIGDREEERRKFRKKEEVNL